MITAPPLVQDHAEHACQLFMDSHPCSVCAATALREEPLNRHPGTQGKADPIVIHLNDVALEKDQVNFARKKKNNTKNHQTTTSPKFYVLRIDGLPHSSL